MGKSMISSICTTFTKIFQEEYKRVAAVTLSTLAFGSLVYSVIFYEQKLDTKDIQKAKYEMNDNAKWISNTCEKPFKPTLVENLNVIRNYPAGNADRYLSRIGGNKNVPTTMRQFPVFVTAMNYEFFPYCQGMFKALHGVLSAEQNRGKGKIIVYDLGLRKQQLTVLKDKCRCEIRRFPFELFPPHVRNLKTYAFKPIIVQMTLMEFGFVWWTDSSVKFQTTDLDNAIEYAKQNSVLFFVERTHPEQVVISLQTDIRTFNYLNEDICKYRYFVEVWATTVLFHFDTNTKAIVNAWASCALNEACIAPVGEEHLACDFFDTRDGRCHRFDQSALSIILRRVYHEQNEYPLDNKLNNIFIIRKRERFDYF